VKEVSVVGVEVVTMGEYEGIQALVKLKVKLVSSGTQMKEKKSQYSLVVEVVEWKESAWETATA